MSSGDFLDKRRTYLTGLMYSDSQDEKPRPRQLKSSFHRHEKRPVLAVF